MFAPSSIDTFSSQRFPQPKAIRDNSGHFRQETFFPGSKGNVNAQQNFVVQKPILPIPAVVQLRKPPAIVNSSTQPEVDTSVVRSVHNRQNFVEAPTTTTIATTIRQRTTTEAATPEELQEQAKSAHYQFETSVYDTINDQANVRQEIRDVSSLIFYHRMF